MIRIALGGAAALAVLLIAVNAAGFPFEHVLRDPNWVSNQAWWVGSVSLLGVFGWGITGTLWGSAAWVRRSAEDGSETWRFLASGAALFLVAGIDDALMLHERAVSRDSDLIEYLIIALYAGVAAGWALRFRSELLQRKLLLGALICFATSVVLDVGDFSWSGENASEDYFKYVGLWGLLLTGVSEVASAARREPGWEGLGRQANGTPPTSAAPGHRPARPTRPR